jgi:NAD(P)-dependent dehydrogenase (short-subunit alcohol dehydrogenase family)
LSRAATPLTKQLAGKRAFITGGGSGLGLAFGELLAQDGWQIGLLDRDAARLKTAQRHLEGLGAERVLSYVADVTDENAFGAALANFAETAGGLEFMANNAGVAVAGSIVDTPAADWRWALEINVLGVANGCRFALKHLKMAERACILNVASAAAFAAAADMGAYNASKAAVVALTETLAQELEGTAVHAAVAMPGFFPTLLLEGARAPAEAMAMAQKLMHSSKYSADRAAADMLKACAAGKLYIVLPKAYARLWRLKRFWPAAFMALLKRTRRRALARRAQRTARGGGSTART